MIDRIKTELAEVKNILHVSMAEVNSFAELKEKEAAAKPSLASDVERAASPGTPTARRAKRAKRAAAGVPPLGGEAPASPGAYREQVLAMCQS